MKKVAVIGHFAFGLNYLDGQTVKTKIVTSELEKQLGANQVSKIDTHGGAKIIHKLIVKLVGAFRNNDNIVILPASNGIKFFVPMCVLLNKVFHRKLHYVVIGGWLSELLKQNPGIKKRLKEFDCIYVETNEMKLKLNTMGLQNVVVMPNFKQLKLLREEELVIPTAKPYKLCTFSRVMKEKGIEDAVKAVHRLNEEKGCTEYTLDIYGQIDPNQGEWFQNQQSQFPEYVTYKGLVEFDKSVEVIKNYYLLLFPTFYEGEGFAGTLLDAMAAGVPAIASDWKYNSEIINANNGLLFETHNVEDLVNKIKSIKDMDQLKRSCLREAQKYSPQNVIQILLNRL